MRRGQHSRTAVQPQRSEVSLEMRPECERCGSALAEEGVAFICSYECTFCAAEMDHLCPNCGGELVVRPRGEKAFSP